MAHLLTDIQREWMQQDFAWGRTDCGLGVLDYVCRATGRRPAIWPEHTDEASAGALLVRWGGLLAYASALMSEMGLAQTDNPGAGDVGIVCPPIVGETCAIHTGRRWMLRGQRRVALLPLDHVRAWRVI